MMTLILILMAAAVITAAAIIAMRAHIHKSVAKLEHQIHQLTTRLCGRSDRTIREAIETAYGDTYVKSRERELFRESLTALLTKAFETRREMNFLHMRSHIIDVYINDCRSLDETVDTHNELYMKRRLDENAKFFDTILKYPLDPQQRRSIVSEEDNCLVISSAGSGKTSSIIGKTEYLVKIRHADPSRILLISYTNKAAAELTERMQIPGLKGCTFHKLAIDLIGQITGEKPSICENTDAVFIAIYKDLLKSRQFRKAIIRYFYDFQHEESKEEQMEAEERRRLSEAKSNRYRSPFPDMDGHIIYVRSRQEQKICSILASIGLNFRYEEPYEHQVADGTHSQYRPDFSIHYNDGKEEKRIYLEHFGIDEHCRVPIWFAQDKGISYLEANKRYSDGIEWKKATHEKYHTPLICTTSADFRSGTARGKIVQALTDVGVPISTSADEDMYETLIKENSKQEKAFIRTIISFITLMKTGCRDIRDILATVKADKDERSRFAIENIVQPIYKKYEKYLNESKQKDFTDIIIEATELCRRCNPTNYTHIIVDEFQDISIDRYRFLQALREGTPPAELYCVGDDWQSIYRFSGSDMSLFSQFQDYFGPTDINRIETTYRFGNPTVSISSRFIQRNPIQIRKDIRPFNTSAKTSLVLRGYDDKVSYISLIEEIIREIPSEKSVFLLGRYSFDDQPLAGTYKSVKNGTRFCYQILGREIEFLTVHKSKGLEADYVILLQCNDNMFGFPSAIGDDPILQLVLSKADKYPYGEERRLFYVAITRAKVKTIILYDKNAPSVFVKELMTPPRKQQNDSPQPATITTTVLRNANKRWTRQEDVFLLQLYKEGKTIRQISTKMGRSQTAIMMRLQKLGVSER